MANPLSFNANVGDIGLADRLKSANSNQAQVQQDNANFINWQRLGGNQYMQEREALSWDNVDSAQVKNTAMVNQARADMDKRNLGLKTPEEYRQERLQQATQRNKEILTGALAQEDKYAELSMRSRGESEEFIQNELATRKELRGLSDEARILNHAELMADSPDAKNDSELMEDINNTAVSDIEAKYADNPKLKDYILQQNELFQ